MTAPRLPRASYTKPAPNRLLQTSLTSWYTTWKARQHAEAGPPSATATPPEDGGADALARWLKSGSSA